MGTARRGFTLIELLVAVSIIALLLGLLLPAVQAAREAARSAQCRSNLHDISVAIQAGLDRKGRLPHFFNTPSRDLYCPTHFANFGKPQDDQEGYVQLHIALTREAIMDRLSLASVDIELVIEAPLHFLGGNALYLDGHVASTH